MRIHCCSAALRLDLVDFVVDFLFVVDLVVVDLVFVAPVFSLLAGTRFLGKIPTVEPALPYGLAQGGGRSRTPAQSVSAGCRSQLPSFSLLSLSLDSEQSPRGAVTSDCYCVKILTSGQLS